MLIKKSIIKHLLLRNDRGYRTDGIPACYVGYIVLLDNYFFLFFYKKRNKLK